MGSSPGVKINKKYSKELENKDLKEYSIKTIHFYTKSCYSTIIKSEVCFITF